MSYYLVEIDGGQINILDSGGNIIDPRHISQWLGSTAPTVGQKAMTSSIPVVVASDQSPFTVVTGGILNYIDAGKIFSCVIQEAAAASNADNAMILIKNPVGSGKKLYLWKLQAGSSVLNVGTVFKICSNPTVTANGTAVTPVNRHIGNVLSSSMEVYKLSTITSIGTTISGLTQGQNSNAIIFGDEFSIRLNAGSSLLITARPSSNNREQLITTIWMEETA